MLVFVVYQLAETLVHDIFETDATRDQPFIPDEFALSHQIHGLSKGFVTKSQRRFDSDMFPGELPHRQRHLVKVISTY